MNNLNEEQIMSREIYLYGEVNDESAIDIISSIKAINDYDDMLEDSLISDIMTLESEGILDKEAIRRLPGREPITLEINSNGGSSPSGFTIIKAIENSTTPVIAYVTGNCMSMAIPIVASCDFRMASEYSKFMIHDVYSASEGKFNDLNSSLEYISSVREDYIEVTSKYTNLSSDSVKKITDKNSDYFFSAEEALEMGLIDHLDGNKFNEESYFEKLYPSTEETEEAEENSEDFELKTKEGRVYSEEERTYDEVERELTREEQTLDKIEGKKLRSSTNIKDKISDIISIIKS